MINFTKFTTIEIKNIKERHQPMKYKIILG